MGGALLLRKEGPPSTPRFEVGEYFGQPAEYSVQRLSLTARLLRSLARPDKDLIYRYSSFKDPSVPRYSLEQVVRDYHLQIMTNRLDASIYSLELSALQHAGTLLGGMPKLGAVEKIIVGSAIKGGQGAARSGINELNQAAESSASGFLDYQLGQLRQKGQTLLANDLLPLSDEQRLKALQLDTYFQKLDNTNVTPEDRAIIERYMLRDLDDRLRNTQRLQGRIDAEQDAKIAANAVEIGKVAHTLNEFKRETQQSITKIQATQAALRQDVSTLKSAVAANTADIDITQRALFEKMSAEEKAQALKSGFFRNLAPEAKQQLEAEVAVAGKKENLARQMADFANGGGLVASLAGKLGVDKNLVEALQKGAAFADAANAVVNGMMSGPIGYLQAANAVAGLVFSSGPDIATQRHDQVMQALGDIQEDLGQIKEALGEIGKGIEQIQKTQIEIRQDIQALGERIQKNHLETIERLTDIQIQIVSVQQAINEVLFYPLRFCRIFGDQLNKAGFHGLDQLPFLRIARIYQDNGTKCLDGLKAIFVEAAKNGTYELARFEKAKREGFLEETKRYQEATSLLWSFAKGRENVYFRALISPVDDADALSAKLRLVSKEESSPVFNTEDNKKLSESDSLQELMGKPLSTDMILAHSTQLAHLHVFYDLGPALLAETVEKVLNDSSSEDGAYSLARAVDLVRIAIAQQVLLEGDVFLDHLDQLWRKGTSAQYAGEDEIAFKQRRALWLEKLAYVLEQPLLRHNLIMYATRKWVLETSSLSSYKFYYGEAPRPGELGMRRVLPSPMFFLEWRSPSDGMPSATPPAWHIMLDAGVSKDGVERKDSVPLPTPAELEEGYLRHTPALELLRQLELRLLGELAAYELPGELPAYQLKALRVAAWQAAGVSE